MNGKNLNARLSPLFYNPAEINLINFLASCTFLCNRARQVLYESYSISTFEEETAGLKCQSPKSQAEEPTCSYPTRVWLFLLTLEYTQCSIRAMIEEGKDLQRQYQANQNVQNKRLKRFGEAHNRLEDLVSVLYRFGSLRAHVTSIS